MPSSVWNETVFDVPCASSTFHGLSESGLAGGAFTAWTPARAGSATSVARLANRINFKALSSEVTDDRAAQGDPAKNLGGAGSAASRNLRRRSSGTVMGLKVFMSTTTAVLRARNTGWPRTLPS